jgi:hypothetical protein
MRGSNLGKTHPEFSTANDENGTAAAPPSFSVGTKYQARKVSTTPNNEAMEKKDAIREFERQGYDIFWQSIGKLGIMWLLLSSDTLFSSFLLS